MNLLRLIIGARLRRRWRALVVIAVVAGIGLGASSAAIGIARRTESSYRRIAETSEAVQVEWTSARPPQEVRADLLANPDPLVGEVRQWVGYVEVFQPFGASPDYLAPWHADYSLEQPFILDGSPPQAENEILMGDFLAEQTSVGIGDTVEVGFMTSDFSDVVPFSLTVTGTGTFPAEWGLIDETGRSPVVVLSRVFAEAHPEVIAWSSAGSVFDDPPSRVEATERFAGRGVTVERVSVEKEASTRAALQPAVSSLFVLGGLGLIATISIAGFALSRELTMWTEERSVLHALGSHKVRRLDATYVGAAIVATTLVALFVYAMLGRIGMVGDLRRFDPDPSFFFDWLALPLLVAGALSVGLLAMLLAGRSASTVPARRGGDLGFALLVGSAASSWRTIGLTMAMGTLGFAAAAATVPYAMSLDALVEDPARYGQAWEVMARNRWGDQAPDAIARIAADPAVDAAATMASGAVLLDGWLTASGSAYNTVVGPDLMTITNGRAATRSNEAVIGASTLRALGAELGDTVEMIPGASNGAFGVVGTASPQTVTLVGEALFPAMVVPGAAVPRLDQGVAMSRQVWNELHGFEDEPEVTLLSTRSEYDAHLLAGRVGDIDDLSGEAIRTEWFVGTRPVEIESAADARRWMVSSLVVLTIVVAGLLGLALRLVLRTQQRDLAVLRALGTTRRQLRAIVWKQGAMLFLPMAVVGVPIGIAFGRLLYSRLADKIGVVSDPNTPWWAVAAFVAAVAAMSAVAVIASGRAVNRLAPALSLRET